MCYNCSIDAWSKSGMKDAVDRAQGALERMAKISEKLDAPDLKPDVVSYSSVINAIQTINLLKFKLCCNACHCSTSFSLFFFLSVSFSFSFFIRKQK